jgi:hypothetical protein
MIIFLFTSTIILAIIGLLILLYIKKPNRINNNTTKQQVNNYYLKTSILTPTENSFFTILQQINSEETHIVAKVRLADIFGVNTQLLRSEQQRALNKITHKHVDFLLIQKTNGKPLLGIELDDSSHQRADRIARDIFVDSIYTTTGLPILHIEVKQNYDKNLLIRNIKNAIAQNN